MQTNPLVSNSLLNTLLKYEPQFAREFANFISQGFYSESGNLVDDVKRFFNQKGFYLNYSEALQIVGGLNEFIHYTSTGESLLACTHEIHPDLLPILNSEILLSKNSFPQEEIALIQDLLCNHGYTINDQEYGYFGNETENAVKDFQQQNGLTVDGVVGSQTLATLLGLRQEQVKQPTPPKEEAKEIFVNEEDWAINPNNKEEVGGLQDLLRSLNHHIDDHNGRDRGIYGPKTRKAVCDFQRIVGLKVTGRVDEITLTRLKEVAEDYQDYQLPEGIDLKPGALIYNLSPEIESVFSSVIEMAQEHDAPKPVITSGNDSTHKKVSKHYINDAIDIRGNNVTNAQMREMAATLQEKLGKDYDVLAEIFSDDPNNDHIHIEYDPD